MSVVLGVYFPHDRACLAFLCGVYPLGGDPAPSLLPVAARGLPSLMITCMDWTQTSAMQVVQADQKPVAG